MRRPDQSRVILKGAFIVPIAITANHLSDSSLGTQKPQRAARSSAIRVPVVCVERLNHSLQFFLLPGGVCRSDLELNRIRRQDHIAGLTVSFNRARPGGSDVEPVFPWPVEPEPLVEIVCNQMRLIIQRKNGASATAHHPEARMKVVVQRV